MITETEYMCYFIHKQIGITPCEITDEHYESTDGRFAFYVCPVQEMIMKNKRYKDVKYKL